MSPDSTSDLESRLAALETDVRRLCDRVESLWDRMTSTNSGFTHEASISFERAGELQHRSNESTLESPSLFDRFLHGETFTNLSATCFLLVVALALRVITENGVIHPDVGSAAGILYCAVLVLFSLSPAAKRRSTGLTAGICGLILLGSIVLETYRSLHGISLAVSFWVLLAGMFASVLVARRHSANVVGWIGLTAAPLLFVILTVPVVSYDFALILLMAAFIVALGSPTAWGLWPARVSLSVLAYLFLFSWDSALNAVQRQAQAGDDIAAGWYSPATLSITFLILASSFVTALRRRPLTSFEKFAPALALVAGYFFLHGDLSRRGIQSPFTDRAGLALSIILLLAGVWFGIRDRERHYGLRTFLCAGIVLFLLTSSSVFYSSAGLAVLFSISAAALFLFAAYFQLRSGDLRMISYLVQCWAFLVAVTSGALTSGSSFPIGPTVLALFLSGCAFLHYLAGRKYGIGSLPDSGEFARFADRVAAAPLFCAVVSAFLFGRNLMAGSAPGLSACVESVWLSVLAASLLLGGNRSKNREIMAMGLLAFAAAAVKVLVIDLLQGTGVYIVISVFTFGSLVGISSYFLHKEREGAK